MRIKDARGLLGEMVGMMYEAEKQQERTLLKMADAASDQALSDVFLLHIDDTVNQAERLSQIADLLEVDMPTGACVGMNGLVMEAGKLLARVGKSSVRDAALIPAAQKIEHYEIASYSALCDLSRSLGEEEIAHILTRSLNEERKSDEMLSVLGREAIHGHAVRPAA